MLWTVAVAMFFAGSVYVIGGRELMRSLRQMRRNAGAALQPPTAAEMQAARIDTPTATNDTDQVTHVTPGMVVGSIASILGVAITLFYVSGRRRRRRPSA